MRRFLTSLVLILPAVVGAVEEPDAVPTRKNSIPALDILPDGSELKGVMIPRYDEALNLSGVLKSEKMTLVGDGKIAGTVVSMELFNPDQSSRARLDLAKAVYDQKRDLIESHEPVKIRSSRVLASGSGLVYYFPSQEPAADSVQGTGFLLGPATTTILPAPIPATSMKSPIPPLRATAMLGMALVSAPLAPAAERPVITTEEKSAVAADAVSRSAAVRSAAAAVHTTLDKDLADAEVASKAAANFLVQADLPASAPDSVPDAKPLEMKSEPGDTVIQCEGGMYFDPDEGVLVYLKNVTVRDPRFDLSGTINELKVFFGKKPAAENQEKPKEVPAEQGIGGFGANFGDVERIVATGAVVLDQKPAKEGDEPIHASGAIFSYNIKADQVIISGGYPWIIKGKQRLQALAPNLNLRISPKAGSFVTEGNWKSSFNLEQKK